LFVLPPADGDINSLNSSQAAYDESQTVGSRQTTLDQEDHLCKAVHNEELRRLIIPDSGNAAAAAAGCSNSDHPSVKLPNFEHFLRPSSIRPITELGGFTDVDQLETERADFQDIPARFQQNFAWPSVSDTKSCSTLSSDVNSCNNEAVRDRRSNSCRLYSRDDKSADTRDSRVTEKQDSAVDSNGHISASRPACPAVSVSVTDHLSSRLSVGSSGLSQQVTFLSQQLSAQVIYTHKFPSLLLHCWLEIRCRYHVCKIKDD